MVPLGPPIQACTVIHCRYSSTGGFDLVASALRRCLVASERASRLCCCGAALQLAGCGAGCSAEAACTGPLEPVLGGCRRPRATREPGPLRGLSRAPGGARERRPRHGLSAHPVRAGAGSGASGAGTEPVPPETAGGRLGRSCPPCLGCACVIWCVWCLEGVAPCVKVGLF